MPFGFWLLLALEQLSDPLSGIFSFGEDAEEVLDGVLGFELFLVRIRKGFCERDIVG